MGVGILFLRLPYFRRLSRDAEVNHNQAAEISHKGPALEKPRTLPVALSVYVVLMILTFALNLIPPVNVFIGAVKFNLSFPQLQTTLGWVTPPEVGRAVNIFGHPGAILFYSSLIAFLTYTRAGYYRPGAFERILKRVARGAINSSLGILSMVGMAVVMSHTGMTNILAEGLSHSFGKFYYPLSAPLIGALGAFITGSNNNSNVLFAVLQMRAAQLLKLSVPLILGAQTVGGSLGSVMAPAKVIVGCSTVGLGDQEGLVMRKILVYGIIPVVVVSLVVAFFAWAG